MKKSQGKTVVRFKAALTFNNRVKTISLRDNETKRFCFGQKTSEGFQQEIVEFKRKKNTITRTSVYCGRDCDGPYKEVYEDTCSIYQLRAMPRGHFFSRPFWPAWSNDGGDVTDIFAQSMNY